MGHLREEEENNLPQMKKLFFLYVWLNLTCIAELRKGDLTYKKKNKLRIYIYFVLDTKTYKN